MAVIDIILWLHFLREIKVYPVVLTSCEHILSSVRRQSNLSDYILFKLWTLFSSSTTTYTLPGCFQYFSSYYSNRNRTAPTLFLLQTTCIYTSQLISFFIDGSRNVSVMLTQTVSTIIFDIVLPNFFHLGPADLNTKFFTVAFNSPLGDRRESLYDWIHDWDARFKIRFKYNYYRSLWRSYHSEIP